MVVFLCGALFTDNVCTPIGVDESTGEVVILDNVTGPCVISELTVSRPIYSPSVNLLRIATQLNADGVILCEGSIITIQVDTVRNIHKIEVRNSSDPTTIIRTINADVDQLVEEEITITEEV